MALYLRILKYLAPYKVTIVLTWVISIAVLCLQGISVWIGAEFLEELLSGKTNTAQATPGMLAAFMNGIADQVLQQSTPFGTLLAAVGVLLGAAICTTCLRVYKTYLFAKMNQQIVVRIRSQLFEAITQMDLSFSRTCRPGELASIFLRDTEQLEHAITDAVDRIFMQPLRLAMATALMLSLSVKLTLVTFSFLLASSLAVHFSGNKIQRLFKAILEKAADLQGGLTEYLSAVVVSRSLGKEDYEQSRFIAACRSLAAKAVEHSVVRALVPQMVKNLFVLSGALLLVIGGYAVLVAHTLSGGALIKMVLLLPVATYPIEALSSLYLSIRASMASAGRIFALMDKKRDQAPVMTGAHKPGPLRDEIRLKDVFYETNGHAILHDINLSFPRGGRTVIFGPSGAGKTTILSLIAKLAIPSRGAVLVDGIDLKSIDGPSWRRQLGIVIQEPVLLNNTVRENLKYAKPDADEDALRQALKDALLWGPDGCVFAEALDTNVGNRGELISGGERQRLTIARAILNNPDIILMDEPTAMMDEENKKKIRDTVLSVSKNRTLILVTHDPWLGEIADRQYRIASGRIVSC